MFSLSSMHNATLKRHSFSFYSLVLMKDCKSIRVIVLDMSIMQVEWQLVQRFYKRVIKFILPSLYVGDINILVLVAMSMILI